MAKVTGVLLAAGFATRFGGQKLLADIKGRPLIAHSAASLAPCDQLIAVVRANDTELLSVLHSLDVDYVINPQPERGMGYSIACAVSATADSDGWCLLPADMPGVQASTTQQLVEALAEGAPLAAPFLGQRRGHPVAFGQRFYQQLIGLDGEQGGRGILHEHGKQLVHIDTDDAGVLKDIDAPDDMPAP